MSDTKVRAPEGGEPWWLQPWILFIVMGVLLTACVAGIYAAVRFDGELPYGPLSEWIPGTITAFALIYTLSIQRTLNAGQRNAAERQRQLDERLRTQEESRAEAETRSLADKVYVWIEWASHTFDSNVVEVRWSNVSDAPAYNAVAILHLSDGTTDEMALGTIPPQHRLVSAKVTKYTFPVSGSAPPGLLHPVGAACRFRDANGRSWQRDTAGALSPVAV